MKRRGGWLAAVQVAVAMLHATASPAPPALTCQETAAAPLQELQIPCSVHASAVTCADGSHLNARVTFSVLQPVPALEAQDSESSWCIGVHTWFLANHSTYFEHRLTFARNFSVGVLVIGNECWTSRAGACSGGAAPRVRVRADVLALPPLRATAESDAFWDFSAPLLRAALGWLRALYVQGMNIPLRDMHVRGLAGCSLQNITIAGYCGAYNGQPIPHLQHLPSLKLLNLTENGRSELTPALINGTENIEHLLLSFDQFSEIPTCIRILRNLKELRIESNVKDLTIDTRTLTGLSKLEVLSFTDSPILYWPRKFPRLPSLKQLLLSGCGIQSLNDSSLDFPLLESLDISNNLLNYLSGNLFIILQNLQYLDLSINFLHNIPDKTLTGLSKLCNANFSSNLLKKWPKLPANKFQNIIFSSNSLTTLENLGNTGISTDYLDVSFNNISRWEDEHVFTSALGAPMSQGIEATPAPESPRSPWAPRVNLSQNAITSFSEAMLESLSRLREVDLGGNILDCSNCDTPRLQRWLRQAGGPRVLALGDPSAPLLCFLPADLRGVPVLQVRFDEAACRDPRVRLWWGLGLPLGAVLCAVLLVGSGVCYHRTKAAYLLHLDRVRSTAASQRRAPSEAPCVYDAFVCYSGRNRKWVIRSLMPLLECPPHRYRLCIHDRDFPLGNHIVTSIVDAIDQSRKVIAVLTQDFIDSKWCEWEMQMVQHKMFEEDRGYLVLLELEALERRRLPRLLRFLLDTRAVVR